MIPICFCTLKQRTSVQSRRTSLTMEWMYFDLFIVMRVGVMFGRVQLMGNYSSDGSVRHERKTIGTYRSRATVRRTCRHLTFREWNYRRNQWSWIRFRLLTYSVYSLIFNRRLPALDRQASMTRESALATTVQEESFAYIRECFDQIRSDRICRTIAAILWSPPDIQRDVRSFWEDHRIHRSTLIVLNDFKLTVRTWQSVLWISFWFLRRWRAVSLRSRSRRYCRRSSVASALSSCPSPAATSDHIEMSTVSALVLVSSDRMSERAIESPRNTCWSIRLNYWRSCRWIRSSFSFGPENEWGEGNPDGNRRDTMYTRIENSSRNGHCGSTDRVRPAKVTWWPREDFDRRATMNDWSEGVAKDQRPEEECHACRRELDWKWNWQAIVVINVWWSFSHIQFCLLV